MHEHATSKSRMQVSIASKYSSASSFLSAGRKALAPVLLMLPVAVIFVIFYIGSIIKMLSMSFNYPNMNINHYITIFQNSNILKVLLSSLWLAISVTLICLILAYPVALVLLRSSERVRKILTLIVIIPMWVSTLVRSYAWMVLLGRKGAINEGMLSIGLISQPVSMLYTTFAVYIGLVYVLLPFMVFPIYSSMRQVNLHLLSAGRSLGASPLVAMLAIFVPLTIPGAAVGCVLVFVMALSYWVTPSLLGGLDDTTFVMLIEQQINLVGNMPLAATMSVILLVITLAILFVFQRLLGFGAVMGEDRFRNAGQKLVRTFTYAAVRLARFGALLSRYRGQPATSMADSPGYGYDDRRRIPVAWIITGFVVVYLVGPILILFPLSFSPTAYMEFPPSGISLQWYQRYLDERIWIESTLVSLRVALATTAIAVAIGTMAALSLAKAKFRMRGAVLAVIMSPLLVPNVVIAVALYFQLSPFGLVGTQGGLVIAHLILTIPFVIMVILGALQSFDYSLELAARSLGASPLVAFRRIMLPLILPSIIAAAFFAFIISFDEVIIAVFLSGPSAPTLPKQLLNATRFEFRPTIAAVSVVLICLTIIIVLCTDALQRYASRYKTGATSNPLPK